MEPKLSIERVVGNVSVSKCDG